MDHRWVELARTLRHLGWSRHLGEDAAGAAEREVASGGYPFVLRSGQEGIGWFFVDGEAMAEAGAVPRFFTLHAGADDGIVWLLDARVVAAVAGSGLLPEHETPALATHG
jgi:hypothetical protein